MIQNIATNLTGTAPLRRLSFRHRADTEIKTKRQTNRGERPRRCALSRKRSRLILLPCTPVDLNLKRRARCTKVPVCSSLQNLQLAWVSLTNAEHKANWDSRQDATTCSPATRPLSKRTAKHTRQRHHTYTDDDSPRRPDLIVSR